jgi:hypothetical protein
MMEAPVLSLWLADTLTFGNKWMEELLSRLRVEKQRVDPSSSQAHAKIDIDLLLQAGHPDLITRRGLSGVLGSR